MMGGRKKRPWDGIFLATMAGMIATLAKDVPNFILHSLGVLKTTYWHMAASAFLLPRDACAAFGSVVGVPADLIVGGGLGVIIMQVFKVYGLDLWWYKGFVAGNIIWFIGLGMGARYFARILPLEPMFVFVSLLEHQIFGLLAAHLIRRWMKPNVIRSRW